MLAAAQINTEAARMAVERERERERHPFRRDRLPTPATLDEAAEYLARHALPAPSTGVDVVTLTTDGFTAICPVTGIPDHGEVVIEYWPSGHLMELETVRHYLTAYRHQHMTVEYTAARIADDVQRAINPLGVRVTVRHNPREGLHNQAVAVRTRNGEPLDATTAS